MKVLGIGNALVDILVKIDDDSLLHQLKLPKGSMQLIGADAIPSISKQLAGYPELMVSGGSAANTIHGLARLGVSCGYLGKVGKDNLGNFYAKDLADAGVQSTLLTSNTVTGRAYTLITKDGERTFATYLGAAIEMNDKDLNPELFAGYSILHIEGYLVQNSSLIETALKIARKKGMKISLDLASYNVVEGSLDFLSRIIPDYVDIVFANEDEARAYTKKDPVSALSVLAGQCDTAVVKLGKDGSLIRQGGKTWNVDILPVEALDTTGAGDQYAAGFLYGFINKLNPGKCGQIGALLAGKVIEDYGARIRDDKWTAVIKRKEEISE
jgi:sugar/nucleoside kinase (ribokinase family)